MLRLSEALKIAENCINAVANVRPIQANDSLQSVGIVTRR